MLQQALFLQVFPQNVGYDLFGYLNIVRVSAAAKMLSKGMPAGEAALAAGFGTIRSFNRVFKQLTGFTPRELPDNYVFIGGQTADDKGFDPTLPVSRVI